MKAITVELTVKFHDREPAARNLVVRDRAATVGEVPAAINRARDAMVVLLAREAAKD